MYYYEHTRTISNNASSWFFFEYIYIVPLTETLLIETQLIHFFHNKQLTDDITSSIMKLSGGHQGLILELIKYILIKWQSINFNLIKEEIENYVFKLKLIDSLSQEFSKLPLEDLKYLCSFKVNKIIEVHENEIVKHFQIKGVLVKKEDLYIGLIDGVISNLLKKIYKSKTMSQHKKLILCIHGLNGSEETWAKFKKIYSEDISLNEEYDFATYIFPTTMWWNLNVLKAQDPPIHQLTEGLKTEIEYKYGNYSEITFRDVTV